MAESQRNSFAGRWEADPRHHPFDFQEVKQSPENIQELFQNHESFPWQRRAFMQEAVLDQLIESSGFPKEWQMAEEDDERSESEECQQEGDLGRE